MVPRRNEKIAVKVAMAVAKSVKALYVATTAGNQSCGTKQWKWW